MTGRILAWVLVVLGALLVAMHARRARTVVHGPLALRERTLKESSWMCATAMAFGAAGMLAGKFALPLLGCGAAVIAMAAREWARRPLLRMGGRR